MDATPERPGAAPAPPSTDAPASGELTYDQVEAMDGAPAASVAGPTSARHSRFGALRHRHFRNVWFGACGSNVGSWMEAIAIQWVAEQVTPPEQRTVTMGYLAVAQMAPCLFLGLWGGWLADRVNRKKLLLGTQAVMTLLAALLAYLSWNGLATVPMLMVIGGLQGATMAFDIPAWQVLTPRLVPREELTEAIALNGLQFNLARIVGPALAGLLIAKAPGGATAVFVVNAVSFFCVILAVAATPDAPAPPRTNASFWTQTREALAFVFHERGPRAAFMAMVVFSFFATPLQRLLPVYVDDVLGKDSFTFGLLTAFMGAGAVAGALALRLLPRWYPKHHVIPLSIFAGAIAITAFAASDRLVFASVAIFVTGLFWLWTYNMAFAAVQLLVPDQMRGRALAVCNVAVFGAAPLGAMASGYIGHFVAASRGVATGTQAAIGLMSLVLAAAGVVMLIWRTPEVDGLKPGDPGYDRTPGLVRGITGSAHRPRA